MSMGKERTKTAEELADELFAINPTAALRFLRAWLFAESAEARVTLEQNAEATIRNG